MQSLAKFLVVGALLGSSGLAFADPPSHEPPKKMCTKEGKACTKEGKDCSVKLCKKQHKEHHEEAPKQ
jgi:hypothetical protein